MLYATNLKFSHTPAAPLVSVAERVERAVVFTPRREQEVECVAGEGSGAFWAWNKKGQGVEIPAEHVDVTVALLMQGQFTRVHFDAIHRAMLLASGSDAVRLSEVLQHVTRVMGTPAYAALSAQSSDPIQLVD